MNDRQFYWLVTVIFALGFIFPVLPAGLRFDPAARAAAALEGGSGASFKLMWMPLLLLSVWVMAMRFRWLSLYLKACNPWLFAVSAWCLMTALWAPQPGVSFRQAVSITIPMMAGIAFCVAAWQPERFIRVLLSSMVVLLLASLAVGFVRPDIGVHDSTQFELTGAWRGVTYQKNGLGQLASVGVIFWVWAWASRRAGGRLVLANIALAIFLVIASRSSTSLMMSILGSTVICLHLRSPVRLESQYRAPLGLGLALLLLAPLTVYLVAAGSIDFANLGQGFGELFGKDVTFSGRTFIWAEVLNEISRHPWQGIGFNAFWGPLGSPSDAAVRRLGWDCPNGHQGYLDMINEIGVIGFLLFVMFMARHIADLKKLGRIDPEHAALHWGLLTYLLMANLTESGWFKPIQFTHVVGVYSSLIVSRHLMAARLVPNIQPSRVGSLKAQTI